MLSSKVKSRIVFLILVIVLGIMTITLIFKSLEENVVYFFSPSEIYNKSDISINKKLELED